jgi:beta-fructofuranosidase
VANILPPPKRLVRMPSGLLRVQSFEKILDRATESIGVRTLKPLNQSQIEDGCEVKDDCTRISGCSGFQAFVFDEDLTSFRLAASVTLSGLGKCGIVFRLNRETQDGYYLSLDLMKGVAQIRDWGTDDAATGEKMMRFQSLQSGYWYSEHPGKADIQLIAFGSYLELSIDSRVVLCLANSRYDNGAVGFYVESAELELHDVVLQRLKPPSQSDEHLAVG